MGTDLAPRITWSQDDEWYYAAVEAQGPDGQVGIIEVRVSRPWVIRTAQQVRRHLLTTAPEGVNVGAWGNLSDPERWGKLCRYVAGTEAKRQIAEQIKRDGVVIAPWFGEWTIATADAAYRLILAARDGDDASIDQLDRIREHAESGDPAARKALAMINSVAKLVARNLPPPSVIAARLPQIGATPRRAPPIRRRPPARPLPQRQLPPRPTPKPQPRRPKPTSARRPGATPTGGGNVLASTPAGIAAALATPTFAARPNAMAMRPTLTALAPTSLYAPTAPVQAPTQPQIPWWMMPQQPYGGGGGGGGGDMGPDDFMAPEEDDGAGGMLDDDDTYFEDEAAPEIGAFPDEGGEGSADVFDIAEYPEEIAQSQSEEDSGDDEANAAAVEAGGVFPGEGSVGGA